MEENSPAFPPYYNGCAGNGATMRKLAEDLAASAGSRSKSAYRRSVTVIPAAVRLDSGRTISEIRISSIRKIFRTFFHP